METRANYVLIGAFTLAGILGLLGFFVWLAKYQVDRQYDYYDILFSDVSGLSQAADVRFNGLSVGSVVSLRLAEDDPSLVRVRIEIKAGTPVKTDTRAQLQVLGVTGTSFVSLSGGSPTAPEPPPQPSTGVPELMAERSVVEKLTEDAPDLISEAVSLLRDLRGFASRDNQDYIASILKNVDLASAKLETALADFSSISNTVSDATGEIAAFTNQLVPVASAFQETLAKADTMLSEATTTFSDAQTTLKTATNTLGTANGALSEADRLVREDGAATLAELRGTVTDLRAALDKIAGEASGVLQDYGTTAQRATARLDDLEKTLAAIDAVMTEANVTLESVDSASKSFEDLVDGDGTLLVSEARATLARTDKALDAVNQVLDSDMPAVVADVRNAVATANRVVTQVGADVTAFTGQMAPFAADAQGALAAAVDTLHNVNGTLARLDGAMDSAEKTLSAASTTFDTVNGILEDEAKPTAADIRLAAARVGDAVEQISADLPAAAADLRGVISQASDVMGRVDTIVSGAAGPVQTFSQQGLPEFTLLSRELRDLVLRLDRIAARLERDPARFLLGGQAPEYRR